MKFYISCESKEVAVILDNLESTNRVQHLMRTWETRITSLEDLVQLQDQIGYFNLVLERVRIDDVPELSVCDAYRD